MKNHPIYKFFLCQALGVMFICAKAEIKKVEFSPYDVSITYLTSFMQSLFIALGILIAIVIVEDLKKKNEKENFEQFA